MHIDYTHDFEFSFLNGTEVVKVRGEVIFDGSQDINFKLKPPFDSVNKQIMDHILMCLTTWKNLNKAVGKITMCHLDYREH